MSNLVKEVLDPPDSSVILNFNGLTTTYYLKHRSFGHTIGKTKKCLQKVGSMEICLQNTVHLITQTNWSFQDQISNRKMLNFKCCKVHSSQRGAKESTGKFGSKCRLSVIKPQPRSKLTGLRPFPETA